MKRLTLGAFMASVLFASPALAQLAPPPFNPYALRLDTGTKTATAVAGAATLSKTSGVITSEALTTAAAASYTLVLTNTSIVAADLVFVSVALGTATTGEPVISGVKPAAGSVTIIIKNNAASAAVNGTLRISFIVIKA